jgi:hypothetical protein
MDTKDYDLLSSVWELNFVSSHIFVLSGVMLASAGN